MPVQTVWQHIDVPLPQLDYQNVTTSGQGKGSTEWAAHSHTPVGLELWDDFVDLVTAEGQNPRNRRTLDLDFALQLANAAEFLTPVSREEDVTNCLQILLSRVSYVKWDLSGGIQFPQRNQQIVGKPDLIAQVIDNAGLGVGPITEYASPPPGKRTQVRRENTELLVSLYLMPFETKPVWKFSFLETEADIIDEWEIPDDFDAAKMQDQVPLPESWPVKKKKVFHLVRQFYGQMVADKRRYGIIHTYERCFFCKRTPQGILKISHVFEKEMTSPSVLQAIKTMVGFDDHILEHVLLHPQSGSKVPRKTKKRRGRDSNTPLFSPSHDEGRAVTSAAGKGGRGTGSAVGKKNLAASLYPWECDVYDYTDHTLLLTTTKDPSVIVKLQSDPRKRHVADEMANEAAIYEVLEGNKAAKEVIPCFRGYSTHLGVAMTCVEKELDDFADVGMENLSHELRLSAVRAVEVLSEADVLHSDIDLRNLVVCKSDPNCAKIIDFGRASFCSDRKRLAQQVESIKALLKIDQQ